MAEGHGFKPPSMIIVRVVQSGWGGKHGTACIMLVHDDLFEVSLIKSACTQLHWLCSCDHRHKCSSEPLV